MAKNPSRKWPTTSFIIPTYNSGKTIESLLKTILIQDHPIVIEILIIDGGSTDKTIDIVKRYANKCNIRILNNPLKLPSNARRIGVNEAYGDVIVSIDSDMELISRFWLRKMVGPLIKQNCVATYPSLLPNKKMGVISRVCAIMWPYGPGCYNFIAYGPPKIMSIDNFFTVGNIGFT
ncbi:MAG: glycosyltransferase, partial [Candidatus Bathyarchaeota archaeon]|nr:glycosyltransferase [Candidatus Bathyarchaeota archaeon]